MDKKKKKKDLIISLLVAIGFLAVVIGLTMWYQAYKNIRFDTLTLVIADAIGTLVIFGITYRFLRGPKKEKYVDTWDPNK